jgi:hypothetical protein
LGKAKFIVFPILILVLGLLSFLILHYVPVDDFSRQLNSIVKPYRFDLGKWEVIALSQELDTLLEKPPPVSSHDTAIVEMYFSNLERIERLEAEIAAIHSGTGQGDITSLEDELGTLRQQNDAIVNRVEEVLEGQIREALSEHGIFNPWEENTGYQGGFPPVNFILSQPPKVLVVSPRDRIERLRQITLIPEMESSGMAGIETQVDELGVSSLVVGVGGMATYPSYVTERAGLRYVIDAATEEWFHQYLAFKPLGFLYILDLTGIRRDDDIATMNETLAGIASREIGAYVYEKYYSSPEDEEARTPAGQTGFDFNREMREIRKAVDAYLAEGEIERAEEFMEEKRLYLLENGYYIRKLNQAYFAFHGAYADSPTSIDPIGAEMRQLRERSDSLKDFLETVAQMATRQELAESAS